MCVCVCVCTHTQTCIQCQYIMFTGSMGLAACPEDEACLLGQLNEVGLVVDVVHIDHPHTDEAAWGTDRMMH